MKAQMLFIHGITPIHTGTGQSVDVVDLPVAREKTTGWPHIPGSSIKGVLRDECSPAKGEDDTLHIAVFGPDTNKASDSAGSIIICDGHLLCLPVRSFKGTFAWITCPSALMRLNRDCITAGNGQFQTYTQPLNCDQIAYEGSKLSYKNKIYLEDIDLSVIPDASVTVIANQITNQLFSDDPEWAKAFIERFAVVSDDLFTFLSKTATEVVAHIKMAEDGSKTVDKVTGGLWYEEAVPSEAIFWTPIFVAPRNGYCDEILFKHITDQIHSRLIQIGGNASVGRGLVRMVFREKVNDQ